MASDAFVTFGSREAAYLFYLTVAWVVAWAAYGVVALTRRADPGWPWHRVLGVVLILFPFVRYVNGIYESIGAVFDSTTVASAVPASVWWSGLWRRWWMYVLLPMAGLFLATGQHLRAASWGDRIITTLREADLRVGPGGWWRTVVDSCVLFLGAIVAFVAYAAATAPIKDVLATGDESQVFIFLTPTLGFLLAVTAGVTEEIMFRGILQKRLAKVTGIWVAIPVQAILFGLIHSGYGTIDHILGPALFGVYAGIVAARWGLIPAIAIHFLIDLVAFWNTTAAVGYDWTMVGLEVVLALAVLVPATYWTVRLYHWLHARYGPEAPGPGT